MIEAFLWGALGAAALLVGALAAYLFDPSRQVMAVVMALGTGLLIGSVSFELVDEALAHQRWSGWRCWCWWARPPSPPATGC
jgi:zinc transporter ZupT